MGAKLSMERQTGRGEFEPALVRSSHVISYTKRKRKEKNYFLLRPMVHGFAHFDSTPEHVEDVSEFIGKISHHQGKLYRHALAEG